MLYDPLVVVIGFCGVVAVVVISLLLDEKSLISRDDQGCKSSDDQGLILIDVQGLISTRW